MQANQHTNQTVKPKRHTGFTLVEMLVIISIIILLAGIALPTILQVRRQISVKASKTLIRNLESGCKQYRADWGEYPPDRDEDVSAWKCPEKWNGSKVLAQCLLGYFPDIGNDGAPDDSSTTVREGITMGDDGVEGYGFRMKANKRKVGAYVDPEQVRTRKVKAGNRKKAGLVFIDEFDNTVNYTRFDGDGPSKDYFKDNDGDYFRRDFFLYTDGPDGDDTAYRDDPTTDDITNFLPE